jgi:hypothetical protein
MSWSSWTWTSSPQFVGGSRAGEIGGGSSGSPPGVGVVHGRALLADIPDGQSGDGLPQRVIRREDSVVAMPVLPRWRDEIGEPVEELKRAAAGPALCSLCAGAYRIDRKNVARTFGWRSSTGGRRKPRRLLSRFEGRTTRESTVFETKTQENRADPTQEAFFRG